MIDKQVIGIAAGVLTATSLIPQVVKSLKEKKVEGVSPWMFVVLFAGNGLWAYYGIILKDAPIIITNAFGVIMDITMFILKMKYKDNK
ncbi:hypothetical protein DJ568_05640 [Mucilaginibacter hurinus]|uniref:MtN3 and saliva related transmembrane protein n=1 Tax=Mucilaginibacter hurinus TaxID=2201324 RepID=A0A367GSZ8_9SPHI|nr:SemiSWEET transporter [Mucilaginibacter hurinus]RCH56215.1 hypothetical protein DJ568_05640 [Mucilaginibacter hurinus]